MKNQNLLNQVILLVGVLVAFTQISLAQNSNPWPTTGSVGIGTGNNPSSSTKLHIFRSASGLYPFITLENQADYDARASMHFVTGPTSSSTRNIGYIGAEAISKSLILQNQAGGGVEIYTSAGGGQTGLYVDNNAGFDSRANIIFRAGPSTNTHRVMGYVGAEYISNNLYLRNTNGGGVLVTTGSNVGLFVNSAGRVGIGTTAPNSFQLAVEGKIGAREVNVTATDPFPDYVFSNDYDLRPLSQVESYIKENKHLPEIPSAAEVEKNGINLGEMDALLLKKIEELTLYMIEMKKENESLKKEIEILKVK